MLLTFCKHRISILLFVIVSLGYSQNVRAAQSLQSFTDDSLETFQSQYTAGLAINNQQGVMVNVLNYNSGNNQVVIEESNIIHVSLRIFPRKKSLKIDENQLSNTVFRDYNIYTLTSLRFFAPVTELFLSKCVFRL